MTNVTLTTEQAQQIEEALDELRYANNTDIAKTKYYKALSIIRAARAQEQTEQEPVAVISESAIGLVKLHSNGVSLPFDTPLYAAPVRTKDLTDDEIVSVLEYYDHEWDETTFAIARAVIAAHKEKNK